MDTIRKSRRWIENLHCALQQDRWHQIAIERLGLETYLETRLIELSDVEVERLLSDTDNMRMINGRVRRPTVAAIPPYHARYAGAG